MGAWGEHAISNGTAADWFAEVLLPVAVRVAQTFNSGDPMEVRAACHLLAVLGETYVWPIGFLEEQLRRGVDLLEAIKESDRPEDWSGPVRVGQSLDMQIALLKARLTGERSAPGLIEKMLGETIG